MSDIGLSSTPYEWQHVSIVVEQDSATLDFYLHVFVNGKFVKKLTSSKCTATISAEGYDRSKLALSYSKFSAGRDAAEADKYTAIDNFKATFFKAGGTIEQMANYYYKDWVSPYKYTLATLNDAEGNTVYYDDFSKALADADDDEVIKLKADVTDVIIDENAVIDANIYDTDGTTILGTYNLEFNTTKGYVAELNNGIYTITQSSQLININWDPACEGECDCNKLFGGHTLSKTTISVPGNIPEYPYDTPVFETVDGLVKEFLGWSYENDGTVDELVALTADDVAKGEINLYPVYKATQYAIEYINESGITVSYHMADEYEAVVNAAVADSTIKFHSDVTATTCIILKKKLTIDLNGFAFKQEQIRTVTYNGVLNSKGAWVKDGDALSTEGPASAAAFSIQAGDGRYLTYTTSRPGARVYRVYVLKTVLLSEGETVSETVSVTSPTFITYQTAVDHTINLLGDITFYAGNLITNDWNSNVNAAVLNIDGPTFYQVCSSEPYIRYNEGGTFNFNNSKFYVNYFFYNYTSSPGARVTNMYIDNCDITDKLSLVIPSDKIFITNSRIFGSYSSGKTTAGYGTCLTDNESTVSPGYVLVKEDIETTIPLLVSDTFAYDSETLQPTYVFETVDTPKTTNYTVKKCSEVEGSITDARLSMSYYTNFNMMFYLPVMDESGTVITSVDGFTAVGSTVKIDGNEYYAYVKECSTTGASDNAVATIYYTINGLECKQSYLLSALLYADIILNYPEAEVETKAVANMLRYIKEARLAAGLEAGEEFDDLIALGNLAELGEQTDYVDTTVSYSALSGYVESICFMLDGTNSAYVITMTDSAVAAGATVTVSYVNGTDIAVNKSVITVTDAETSTEKEVTRYITSSTKVYDVAANAIEITVTVPAAEEGADPTVITGTYSVKAYINSTNNTLAKAMYEFGIAAKAYREYLIENT